MTTTDTYAYMLSKHIKNLIIHIHKRGGTFQLTDTKKKNNLKFGSLKD